MPKSTLANYNRLNKGETVAVIIGRFIFLGFMLLPFVEMFFVSLKSLAEAQNISLSAFAYDISLGKLSKYLADCSQFGALYSE